MNKLPSLSAFISPSNILNDKRSPTLLLVLINEGSKRHPSFYFCLQLGSFICNEIIFLYPPLFVLLCFPTIDVRQKRFPFHDTKEPWPIWQDFANAWWCPKNGVHFSSSLMLSILFIMICLCRNFYFNLVVLRGNTKKKYSTVLDPSASNQERISYTPSLTSVTFKHIGLI